MRQPSKRRLQAQPRPRGCGAVLSSVSSFVQSTVCPVISVSRCPGSRLPARCARPQTDPEAAGERRRDLGHDRSAGRPHRRHPVSGSGRSPARGFQLGRTHADPILVGDLVPASAAALPGSPNPAGRLQLSEQPEHMVAARIGPGGELRRAQPAVPGQQRLDLVGGHYPQCPPSPRGWGLPSRPLALIERGARGFQGLDLVAQFDKPGVY